MKRKLSLFLVLCLLVGAIAPAAEVRAAGVSEPVLQMEEMVGEMTTKDIGDVGETTEGNSETEKDAQVSVNQTDGTEETTQTDSEEEIVLVEESEEELASEEEESVPEALQTEGFESSYGADNAAVAVTPYSYGADLLVVQKDGSYSSGVMAAKGVIIVEADAGVDLVSYVGKMSNPVADLYEPKELVVGTVTVAETEYPVRYIGLNGTAAESWSEYVGDWFYIRQFSLDSLEPEKTYEYLFVSYDYENTNGSYELSFLPVAKADGEGEAVERILTTKPVPAEDELFVQAGRITSGYTVVGATVQLSGLNGRRMLKAGLTTEDRREDRYTSRCSSDKKILTENLPPECVDKRIVYNARKEESDEVVWYLSTGETSAEVIPYVTIEEYKDGETQEKTVYGDPVTISTIDITNLTVANQEIRYITSNTMELWRVKFSPAAHKEDYDIGVRLCYKIKDAGEYTRCDDRYLSGTSDWEIMGLLPETEYQYCFEITDYYDNVLVTLDGGSFTTAAAPTELTQEEIPDPVLWAYFSEIHGNEGKLTTDDLLKVEHIYIDNYNGKVTELTGIEYARYLRGCQLARHELTDAGVLPLLFCTQLTNIDLQDNELTTMPDFSGMTKLTELILKDNQIPAEEITEDKYPKGVDTDDFWPQYYPREISVTEETVCKDATENGTYGVSLKVICDEYASSVSVRITDITNGGSSVLYENSSVKCSAEYIGSSSQHYSSYAFYADVSGVTATEGTRTWEITCTVGEATVTDVLTVIVDPDGVGGFQTVPETILPKALSDYWAEDSHDKNKDGKISFYELADISGLYIYNRGDYEFSMKLESFLFLPYMTNLNHIVLEGQENFTQESLVFLASLKNVADIELKNVGEITDISVLKNLSEMWRLNLYGMTGVSGLTELKELPIRYLDADPGTFSDADIFNFICNKTEENLAIAEVKSLVSEVISLQSVSDVQVSVSREGVILFDEDNPFLVSGVKVGETDVTYTLGDISYTIHVTVTGEEWDADPELGTIVEENRRIWFTGTEGVENARVSRSMVDGEGNIWNISTRTPEKILESSDYTKYAARLIYNRTTRFSVLTNTANADYSFYLDTDGTLWVYNQGYIGDEDNFSVRYEVMSDVADWQEGGYSEAAYYQGAEYILILRTDGSLWYCSFDTAYDSGVRYLRPRVLEKLEDGGVTGVYPYSYLKDGCLYRVEVNGEKELLAKNIIKVWDNTSVILAQDASGNYYSLQDSYRGKLEMTGAVKEFLVGSYWDSDYVQYREEYGDFSSTGRDMIAGYLLMENGTLYRTEWSKLWSAYAGFTQLDTNVTALEKDYYWKDNTAYWFTGETYADYIGSGFGKGLYPVRERDEVSNRDSITLYVNGVKYLTKVSDWTVADQCIYAVRLDNTLWQFDENNVPHQVDMSALSTTPKNTKVNARDIDILDLKKTGDNVIVKWTPVEGAVSYQLNVSASESFEDWSITNIAETEYVITPTSGSYCYYQIQAVDATGEVLATSWKFCTVAEEPSVEVPVEMKFRMLDAQGTEIAGDGETYSLVYNAELKGQTLLLNVTVEGVENAELRASSSDPSVAEATVNGHSVKLKITGDGTTQITVTEQKSGYEESIQLCLKDYTPKLISDIVEINRALSRENVVRINLIDNTRLTEIGVDKAKLTSKEVNANYVNYITAVLTEDGIRITLDETGRSSKLSNGIYRLPLKVTIEDFSGTSSSEENVKIEGVPLTLKVKISDSKPKISAKVAENINLFYTDTKAVYQLATSTGEIVNAEFIPKTGSKSYFTSSYNSEKGELVMTPKTGSGGKTLWDLSSKELSKALTGQLRVTVGESTLTQNLTISKSTARPKVTLTQISGKVYKFTEGIGKEPVYAGTIISFKPIDNKTKVPYENVTVTLAEYESKKNGKVIQNFSPGWNLDGTEKDYVLAKDAEGMYTIHFVGESSATATLKVQGANWREPISVKYKTTVTSAKMTGKLSTSKVTLNKQYTGDQKTLVLTTNLPHTDFSLGNWEVTKVPKGAGGSQGLEIQKSNNGLSFTLKEGSKAQLKEGTYTIKIPVTFHFAEGISYTPKALNVKVNVLNEKLTSKAVKWKISGKLDVIAREDSGVIAVPAISKLNAEMITAAFSEEDINKGLDQKLILGVESGKLSIRLKSGVSVSTKDKYVIHPVLTVQTEKGENHFIGEMPKITIKPNQSKVKITLDQKSLTMYKGSSTSQTQAVTYTLKGTEGITVGRVESGTKGFTVNLLKDGRIEVRLTDTSMKIKTYTVKLNVYLTDQATNQKPISINIKVVLKK